MPGQRLVEITDIPNVAVATASGHDDGTIEVTFTPDGHRGRQGPVNDPVDGFAAAAALRAADPRVFGVAAGTPVPFGYVDKGTELTAPGDCLIFGSTRVRHARTAFAATAERHLQGCYADLDGLLATLAVLRRRHH